MAEEQPLEFRSLGRSGARVSAIGLGSWLTYDGTRLDEQRSMQCLETAYNAGINLIDTANVYNRGGAETLLGQFLRNVNRRHIFLATKVFFPMSDHWMDQGLSYRHIMNECRRSLERLRTEYIDLYQCHRYDPNTPLEETCYAMHKLIDYGWIYHWGVSQWSAPQILNAIRICERNGWQKPIANQPIYNMINRSLEVEVMQVCEEEGLGLIVYSPLAQGLLTGKYGKDNIPEGSRAADERAQRAFPWKRMTEENFQKLDQLKTVAQKLDCSLPQLALAWILRKKPISSAIIGASKPEQIQDNLKATQVAFNAAVQEEIEQILANAPYDQYTGNRIGHGYDHPNK